MAKKRKTELDLDAIEPPPAKEEAKVEEAPKEAASKEEGAPEGGETPKKSRKKLIIILAISAFLFTLLSVGAYLILSLKGETPEEETVEEEVIVTPPPPVAEAIPLESLAPFFVPLKKEKKGEDRFLKVAITIELSDSQLRAEIERNKVIIRENIYLLLRTQKRSNLKSGGHKTLSKKIKKMINKTLQTGTVKEVYFTELIIL